METASSSTGHSPGSGGSRRKTALTKPAAAREPERLTSSTLSATAACGGTRSRNRS